MGRPGGDLLSRALRHSTMGAGGFHGRVRDGIGWGTPAMTTRSSHPPCDGCQCSVVDDQTTWVAVLVKAVVCLRRLGMISMHGVVSSHRAIRTGQLRALPRLYIRPIDVLVWHGPLGVAPWETWF